MPPLAIARLVQSASSVLFVTGSGALLSQAPQTASWQSNEHCTEVAQSASVGFAVLNEVERKIE